ncbi:MAG TPA: biotin--[acetyl-CoA-carboxylase] ligase [Gaiellaceae bacterium]|nr:biotin--[acetyl-CoA-carboxylase] ligase [Gaiellaceae bacterium]
MSDLSPGSVEPLLQGRLGRPYRFVEECASTQRLLEPDEAEGTTVATNLQTQGRGRLGRTWDAPSGRALLCSVLLHPRAPMALWPELSLVAGDAVATALREQTGVAAKLSHPNDVLIEGRKVAGILPEASVGRVVLGLGVNVNQTAEELPPETPKPATALRVETGREWPRAPLLAAILLELERRYDDWQRLHTNR